MQVIKIVSYYPLRGESLASICHILKPVLCGLHGYYRRGAAYLALGKFKETLKDFSYLVQSMLCQVISLSDRWPHSPSMERMQQMT